MRWLWKQLAIATNWPVFVAVAIVSSLGITSIWAHSQTDARYAADVRRQLIYVGVGLFCMFMMQLLSYRAIGRWAWAFYILSFLLLIYTVLPGMPKSGPFSVPPIKGARKWITFGVMSFEPAELMKVSACMVLARYLRFRSNYRMFTGLVPPFALVAVPMLVILKQPDLGTALLFIPMLFAMLFVAGAKIRHLLAVIVMGVMLAAVAWYAGPKEKTHMSRDLPVLRHLPLLIQPYQRARISAMFRTDGKGGFQQKQALTAFGSGGVSGRGAGNVPVGRTVPEAHNDMIFALIGEQFGFIGAAVLLISFLVLFAAGIEIASATHEPFGRLVATGIVALLAGQTFINLMVSLSMMPVTGVTLPFVSSGGSSLLASFISAGLLLNIGQNRPLVIAKEAFEFD